MSILDNKLTGKQINFVNEYLIDLNATQAAIRAGYAPKNAEITACQNLRKPKIQAAIQAKRDEMIDESRRLGEIATPEDLLKGYSQDLRFNPKQLYNEDGSPKSIHDIPDEIAMSLTGMEVTERVLTSNDEETVLQRKSRFSFPNKNQVRDSMAKVLGLTNGNKSLIDHLLDMAGMTINIDNSITNIQNNVTQQIDFKTIEGAIECLAE